MNGLQGPKAPRVLHVVVGHGLPRYFMNTIRSVRATAPDDPVLVIDNASPQPELRADLSRLAAADDHMELILRSANELEYNRKVGGLYDAYEIAFQYALDKEFGLLHLLQGDFQQMWWDGELVDRARRIYQAHPRCVNIQMQFLSRDRQATDDLTAAGDGLVKLKNYGLTDTGLYHLGRWAERGMRFSAAEQQHARQYLDEGLEVIRHPWPTDAPIPWPPVIRNGVQKGREVENGKPYLVRPLTAGEIAAVKQADGGTWLEDACIPWGWACATPLWVTGLNSLDYWVLRYRDARRNGLRHLLPRLELRGIEKGDRGALLPFRRYRPSLFRLFVAAPAGEGLRWLRQRRGGG